MWHSRSLELIQLVWLKKYAHWWAASPLPLTPPLKFKPLEGKNLWEGLVYVQESSPCVTWQDPTPLSPFPASLLSQGHCETSKVPVLLYLLLFAPTKGSFRVGVSAHHKLVLGISKQGIFCSFYARAFNENTHLQVLSVVWKSSKQTTHWPSVLLTPSSSSRPLPRWPRQRSLENQVIIT